MDWFLYDNDLRHEKFSLIFSLRPGLGREKLKKIRPNEHSEWQCIFSITSKRFG